MNTQAPSFLIGFSFLQITRTCINLDHSESNLISTVILDLTCFQGQR